MSKYNIMLMLPNRAVCLFVVAVIFLLPVISCSKGGGSPTAPDIDNPANPLPRHEIQVGQGHNLLGYGRVYFDPATGDFTNVDLRTGKFHMELTDYLDDDNCPNDQCLTWYLKGYDSSRSLYYIDMRLVNPTTYTVNDLRIIFESLPEGWQVVNPDSYTHNWDPDTPEWDDEQPWWYQDWLNPFIAFEKEDSEREFLPDPDGGGEEIYYDVEELILYIEPGSDNTGIDYIIDGCVPWHCHEPYDISYMDLSSDVPIGNDTSTVYFECIVADWEEDIESVSVYIPDILGPDYPDDCVELNMWHTDQTKPKPWPPVINPLDGLSDEEKQFLERFSNYNWDTLRKYYGNITNKELVDKGWYPGWVIAQSDDFEENEYEKLYNLFWINVEEGGSGGDVNEGRPQIVFSSYEDGSADLFTYCFQDGNVHKLTNDQGVMSDELDPVVYHHAASNITYVAFVSDVAGGSLDLFCFPLTYDPNNIPIEVTAGLDGVNWGRLTDTPEDERFPDISPNTSNIVYQSNQYGTFDLFWIPRTGGIGTRITTHFGHDEMPNYDKSRPVGDWIYFQSNRAGGNFEVYSMNPESEEGPGNYPQRLTFNLAFDGQPTTNKAGWVSWVNDDGGDYEVYLYNGTDTFQLTENEAFDAFPSFSPDGKWLTFMSNREDYNFDVWRMLAEDSGEIPSQYRLTNDPAAEIDPSYGGTPET